jgi:4-hydroxy-2-oxoheptanedioate aldolase
MELPFDHLKHAMAPGQVVSGIWCNLCSEFAMEVVMGAGLDFAIIDTEHVPVDLFMLVRICNRA